MRWLYCQLKQNKKFPFIPRRKFVETINFISLLFFSPMSSPGSNKHRFYLFYLFHFVLLSRCQIEWQIFSELFIRSSSPAERERNISVKIVVCKEIFQLDWTEHWTASLSSNKLSMNWENTYERHIQSEIQSDNNGFLKSVFVYKQETQIQCWNATSYKNLAKFVPRQECW